MEEMEMAGSCYGDHCPGHDMFGLSPFFVVTIFDGGIYKNG